MSGDESALDMFSWKKGKGNVKMTNSFAPAESLSFFVGGASGKYLDIQLQVIFFSWNVRGLM